MIITLLVAASTALRLPCCPRAARPLRCVEARMGSTDAEAEAELMALMQGMRRQGKTDEQILETLARRELEGSGVEVPSEVPPALPTAGTASWGRWSQSDGSMYLELCVDESTVAKTVLCEVQVGFLDVRLADEPLLSGRLAQQVLGAPQWALDDRQDGQRVLCIDLEKKHRPAADSLAAQALFTSLRVNGREVGAPGLVSGVYLESRHLDASASAARESADAPYGSFDGSVPDQRGGVEGGILPLL